MRVGLFKKLWFGHLYLGVAIAAPLMISAASGIILSFHDDLRYAEPPYRLATPAHRPLSADALAESILHHYPNHRLEVLYLPTTAEHSARAKMAGQEPLLVFVHPGTASILEEKNSAEQDGLERLLELHSGGVWGLPGKIAASIAGLGALFLWTTGLWLWFSRSATVKRQSRQPRKSVALHLQIGLLLGGPIAFLALLGALLNFTGTLMQWLDPPPVIAQASTRQQLMSLPLPSLVDTAIKSYPDAPLERIYFPATASQSWRFRFLDGSWGFVNGYDGTLLKLKRPASHWTMLLYPLHSGKMFGIYSNWLLVFSGLTLIFMVSSGLHRCWCIIKLRIR